MRISILLAALLAVTTSGCDSVETEAVDGPVVQFGAASASASEGDTSVEIPVSLTGGDAGATYTVQVLLAASSSTARYVDADGAGDLDNFGSAEGANRVETVTLSGPTDTKVVTIDIEEDDELEAPEAAVFVLQRAEGASIGRDRQFQIEIGTPPIAVTRERPVDDIVTVEGIVTGRFGRYTFIQDGTAGIAIYAFEDTNVGMADINPGDRIQVKGTLRENGANDGAGLGLKQIRVGRDTPAEFSILSRDNELPDAQRLTVAQILADGEQYESERITVTDLEVIGTSDTKFQAGGRDGNYTVTDGTGEMLLRINSGAESELGGEPIPQGTFTFTGPLGQFGGAYQLNPLVTEDLEED